MNRPTRTSTTASTHAASAHRDSRWASPQPMVVAVAISVVLASTCLTPLTTDRGYLLVGGGVVVVLELVSAVSRLFRTPAWLIHLWQLLALAAIGLGTGLATASQSGLEGPWYHRIAQLYLDATAMVQTSYPPVPTDTGVRWLILLLLGVVTILADLLVVTLEILGWAVAPLLSLYLIPALGVLEETRWWGFLAVGAGYLVVLLADQVALSSRWTSHLSDDTAGRHRRTRGWGGARRALLGIGVGMGIPTLALALLLGSILPTFGNLDITSAQPRGRAPVTLTDPTLDLQRNLNDVSPQTILSYTSDSPHGEYLRLTALSKVDASGWHLVPVTLADQPATSVPGLTGPSRTSQVDVTVVSFASQYLPAPYAARSSNAQGAWAWDPQTQALVATSNDRAEATRGQRYRVTSTEPDPDLATFERTEAGVPDDPVTTEVPAEVPEAIVDLTHKVTRSRTTAAAKAVAIQAYLRDARTFGYSTTAPPGTGYDVLTNFLTRTHRGYCIHYAAAMALMARIEGIPSRVAVGFLPGTRSDGSWQVRASNMHAWPELYFDTYGWVRFEPTTAVAQAPAWTVENPAAAVPSASATPTPSTSRQPGAEPTPQEASPSPSGAAAPDQTPTATGAGGTWWRVLVVVLVIALLLAAPMLLRLAVRRHRRAHLDPDRAWREIRDTWLDHGLAWPRGTVRQQARALASSAVLVDRPEASRAVEHLALTRERGLYAARPGEWGDLGADLDELRRALADQRTPTPHWRARWWPVSLVRRH